MKKKTKLLTHPLLPYYSRAGTVQRLLLGRATQMYSATVTSRERTLYVLGGFIKWLCVYQPSGLTEGGNDPILVAKIKSRPFMTVGGVKPNNHSRTLPQGLTTHATTESTPIQGEINILFILNKHVHARALVQCSSTVHPVTMPTN